MTEVTSTLAVWAIPRNQEFVNPGELPFRYQVNTDGHTPWQDGATKVHTTEVTVIVPAGIDLLASAIDTLKEEIKRTKDEAKVRVEKFEKQIANLSLLEHKPTIIGDVE